MPTNIDELQASLMKDISQARDQGSNFSKAAGADERPVTTKRTTGVRIGDRVIGQAELASADKAIQDAVKHLSNEAGLLDDVQRSKFESDVGGKLSQFKEYMLRQSLDLDMKLKQQGYDAAKRARMLQILGGIGGGMAHAFVANSGSGGGDASAGGGSSYGGGPTLSDPGEFQF